MFLDELATGAMEVSPSLMGEADPCSHSHKPMMEGCAGTGGASVGEGTCWGWCQREENLVTGLKAHRMDRKEDGIPGRGMSSYKSRYRDTSNLTGDSTDICN